MTEKKSDQLGELTTTDRGFEKVEFTDSDGVKANITCSSVTGLRIGLDKVEPIILASHAAELGVSTQETDGWVSYPVPDSVFLNACMHLNREQVQGLVSRLQHWLDHESF